MRANQITRITSDFKMDVVKVNYDFLKTPSRILIKIGLKDLVDILRVNYEPLTRNLTIPGL